MRGSCRSLGGGSKTQERGEQGGGGPTPGARLGGGEAAGADRGMLVGRGVDADAARGACATPCIRESLAAWDASAVQPPPGTPIGCCWATAWLSRANPDRGTFGGTVQHDPLAVRTISAGPPKSGWAGEKPLMAQMDPSTMTSPVHILHKRILDLHNTALSAGLASRRAGLLTGLPQSVIASLPAASTPSEQLLSDLGALSDAAELTDGTVPLIIWLTNAIMLTGSRAESVELQRALAQVGNTSRTTSPQYSQVESTENDGSTPFVAPEFRGLLEVPLRTVRVDGATSAPYSTSLSGFWMAQSSLDFGRMCQDLLEAMGFEVVLRVVDVSREVGFLWRKSVLVAREIATSCPVLVHYRHAPLGLDKTVIMADQASVPDFDCGVKWLMTSAILTPELHEWVNLSAKNNLGSQMRIVDRGIIETWLRRFPEILSRYFPHSASAVTVVHTEAVELMAARRYAEAISVLSAHDDGNHPRFSYLLACCHSRLAQNTNGESPHFDEGLQHLRESARRNYLDFKRTNEAWPIDYTLEEIHADRDLDALRRARLKEFSEVYPVPRQEGGGCFPAGTSIHCVVAERPIEGLVPGDLVQSVDSTRGHQATTRVRIKHETRQAVLIRLNDELLTSPNQPLMSVNGWKEARRLLPGDVLVCHNGLVPLSSTHRVEEAHRVFGLTMDSNPFYFANGYLVHNGKH